MVRLQLLFSLVAACTTAEPSTGMPTMCQVPTDCGPRPVWPNVHPTWTTVNSQDVLVFNEAEGRVLVAWSYDNTAWGTCMEDNNAHP